jgi:hypothetical protein
LFAKALHKYRILILAEDMTAIEKIRYAVNNSKDQFLDLDIKDSNDLITASSYLLRQPETEYHSFQYIDLPAKNFVAIGRSDILKNSDYNSLRYLINNEIHGVGWDDRVFNYFESELLENDFPAPGSSRCLEVSTYGGAITCGNGNHRLIAACCWLIATGQKN